MLSKKRINTHPIFNTLIPFCILTQTRNSLNQLLPDGVSSSNQLEAALNYLAFNYPTKRIVP
jgi:hypothetical protein